MSHYYDDTLRKGHPSYPSEEQITAAFEEAEASQGARRMNDSGGTPSTGGPVWVSVREDEYAKMRARIAELDGSRQFLRDTIMVLKDTIEMKDERIAKLEAFVAAYDEHLHVLMEQPGTGWRKTLADLRQARKALKESCE